MGDHGVGESGGAGSEGHESGSEEHGGEHRAEGSGEHGGGHGEPASDGGKIFGGVADGLDAIAELVDDEEVDQALETGATVARAASQAAEAAHEIQEAIESGSAAGIVEHGAGALEHALEAVGAFVPDEARHALEGAAGAVGGVEKIAARLGGGHGGERAEHGGEARARDHRVHEAREGAEELLEETAHDSDVEMELEVDGIDGPTGVQVVSIEEQLSEIPVATIIALVSDDHPVARELLGRECTLTVTRGAQMRHFRGVVNHAHVDETIAGVRVRLRVAPALWLLKRTLDSRIFQDMSVVEVVQAVVDEQLAPRRRTMRVECDRTYPRYEYIVQYQESHASFVDRLLEQEGIFFYFDHDADEDREVLVITDRVQGLPVARAHANGRIPYASLAEQAPDHEAVTSMHHTEHVGARDVVIADYDWTHPSTPIRGERVQRSELEPRLEVYDHTDALQFHDYEESTGYGGSTAAHQAQIRAERLDLDLVKWTMHATSITTRAGHSFEVYGAEDGDFDGRYVALSSRSHGTATAGSSGSWDCDLECIPATMPYRPPRRTPKPMVPGPETAMVVGPAGEEIHVDKHGRIKVQFHWDRLGSRNEHSSCWMRVAQTWAGPGWGTMFIPRIGMEVVVSFLGADPDRPLVTGCVYNGENAVPYPLPDHKTRSTIKTNSSTGGNGYNELRFEDKAGQEEIFIHAQKDFNEVVEHNHSTRVKNDQSNTVDGNQTETVHGMQSMTVDKDRIKTVHENEVTTVDKDRREQVYGSEGVYVDINRTHTVRGNESLAVLEGTRHVTVSGGKDTETYDKGRETNVLEFDNLNVNGGANKNTHVTGQYNITSDGHFKITQNAINEVLVDDSLFVAVVGRVQLKAGDGAVHYDAMPDGTGTIKASTINLEADTKIFLKVGGSTIEMTSSKITIASPTVEVNGQSLVDVKSGGLVKLKC